VGDLCYVGIPENHLSASYCHRLDKRDVNDVLVIHEISKQCMKYVANNTSTAILFY
jgi:hypothetical protein